MTLPGWMPEPGSPLDRIATFILVSLLWVAGAALLITLPAATAGLFAVLAPWVRGRDTELFSTFFSAIRRLWLRSTVLFVGDAVLLALAVINLQAINMMNVPDVVAYLLGGFNLFLALMLLMINVYIWPLLVLFDLPLRRLLHVAPRLALVHPLWSMAVVGLALIPVALSFVVPVLLVLLFGAAAIALIVNWGAWRIIKRYATPQEMAELDHP